MPNKNRDELIEQITKFLKPINDLAVFAHVHGNPYKGPNIAEQITDFILADRAKREREAERRGEASQLKLLMHWSEQHKIKVTFADLQYFHESIRQFPDQALAREVLAALSTQQPQGKEKE